MPRMDYLQNKKLCLWAAEKDQPSNVNSNAISERVTLKFPLKKNRGLSLCLSRKNIPKKTSFQIIRSKRPLDCIPGHVLVVA